MLRNSGHAASGIDRIALHEGCYYACLAFGLQAIHRITLLYNKIVIYFDNACNIIFLVYYVEGCPIPRPPVPATQGNCRSRWNWRYHGMAKTVRSSKGEIQSPRGTSSQISQNR